MDRIDLKTARSLIDFSGGNANLAQLAETQLVGAVALFNRLADRRVAYLADEVGMGKTYIALGVVALMRRFNPSLRVLYLLPKNNVRDKWVKDYKSFVEYNYVSVDLSVKGLGNQPVAPFEPCAGLAELIQLVATSSTRDYFICTSAFSFALGNTEDELLSSLKNFSDQLPQFDGLILPLRNQLQDGLRPENLNRLKSQVKEAWATALNSILPRFDLVVVDEAHNLKKGRETSDRNKLLAMLLDSSDGKKSRVDRLLLLSATPFDRQLDHLRNQLELFGLARQAALPDGNDCSGEEVENALSSLIVRRLNVINLAGKNHTRNMYRKEHRSEGAAEVKMTIEQQLFAALLQKKVSEYLRENCAGRFELGMLASFESYLPGEKNKVIEFDGQEDQGPSASGSARDAQDRHVVSALIEDYYRKFETKPPHPKMDWVASRAHLRSFQEGKKQLIFVRRVRSVSELTFKLERAYDEYIGKYISGDAAVAFWFKKYSPLETEQSQVPQEKTDADDEIAATRENFFTWFYRGRNSELEGAVDQLQQLPVNFRNALAQRSFMFEPNWSAIAGMPPAEIEIDWTLWISPNGKSKPTPQLRFKLAQFAYLKTVSTHGDPKVEKIAKVILAFAFKGFNPAVDMADVSDLERDLGRRTLWDCMQTTPELVEICPKWNSEAFDMLAKSFEVDVERCLRRFITHHELLGVLCRIDHPFIDLYSLRATRKASEEESADSQLIAAFSALLHNQQRSGEAFCSFQILHDVAKNLDLLIKLNFPEAYHTEAEKLTAYLTRQLNPLSPVSGATGENSSNRSPLARKFRMPGYPRVLVSTDVFQEGEDLHTFCDSVIHYGISASPIALEQKVGRVDRINSLADRRMKDAGEQYQKDFIQVEYPHIRESVEFFQVRQAAANLNAFQRSLHTLGTEKSSFVSQIDERQELACSDDIAPQILEELQSKFNICHTADLTGVNFCSQLTSDHLSVEKRLAHVRNRVDEAISGMVNAPSEDHHLRETTGGWIWSDEKISGITINVRSAKGLPELLISATSNFDQVVELDASSGQALLRSLQLLQADPLVRFQWRYVKAGNDSIRIQRNAEVYAGDHAQLIDDEVMDVCRRATGAGIHTLDPAPVNQSSMDIMVSRLCGDDGRIGIVKIGANQLDYTFHHEGREQSVTWFQSNTHVTFSSVVVDEVLTLELAQHASTLAKSPLIMHTLKRNLAFDLVDFHIDSEGRLSVRASHPIAHLNQEELRFIANSVAAEADRLEKVLMGADASS